MVGFKVLTAEDGAMDARNQVVIEYAGPINFPMADEFFGRSGRKSKSKAASRRSSSGLTAQGATPLPDKR